jgi:hypothetical protein
LKLQQNVLFLLLISTIDYILIQHHTSNGINIDGVQFYKMINFSIFQSSSFQLIDDVDSARRCIAKLCQNVDVLWKFSEFCLNLSNDDKEYNGRKRARDW